MDGKAKWMVGALFLGLVPSQALADDDPWFGPDKAKHFGASAVIAVGGYTVGAAVFEDRISAIALGGGLALSAGIGKEVYDAAGYGHASERDLVWDVIGTTTGLGVALAVDWLIRGDLGAVEDGPGAAGTSSGLVLRF